MAKLAEYCKACSLCCKHPFVLPEERDRIAARLGPLGRRLLKKVGNHFIIDADPCPFLKDGSCTIEDIKPLCCRVFPLVLESDGRSFQWVVSEECALKRQVSREFIRQAELEGRRLLEYHNDILKKATGYL